jgi:hypothetical protein
VLREEDEGKLEKSQQMGEDCATQSSAGSGIDEAWHQPAEEDLVPPRGGEMPALAGQSSPERHH